ncbi:hypothetical protein H257_03244 [Aphanomyces astaci]|uniref:Uncharacterized protein n=2 Tax=Aphanomyces astaci TaxID=112090 RepID=W4H1S4_APHAT|nr:hypothetical protein H257_03244 [Aphanomyces astaci]ETV85531.1 hypothetical protein H257_03244 [Aphanomyces astaci]RQM11063.1 hypothetical protein B5M09_009478 [Aphanomyces astaci]|eukprot:XP_009825549.1 hypothetical protein H257_03244 [Aphanomyces astaci]
MGCYQSSAVPTLATILGHKPHATLQPSMSTTSDVPRLRQSTSFQRMPLARVKYPCQTSTWIRGNPVAVEWSVLDPSAVYVKIELCHVDSTATTLVTASAPNTGCFVYSKVPWGLIGDGFYIRIVELVPEASASQQATAPRETLSDVFRVGNSRWPDTASEGSLTPVSVRGSSIRSPSPMSSRWHTEHQPSFRPAASCY